jgi:hypothetical protein
VESYGLQTCYELLEYYFEVAQNPDWKYFSNFTQEIIDSRQRHEQDNADRAQRRKMAKEWLNE